MSFMPCKSLTSSCPEKKNKLCNFNDELSYFQWWLTIVVTVINNLSTAVVLLKQERKINFSCLFDLFPSACIKQQERTVDITTHQHWVCQSLHGQE